MLRLLRRSLRRRHVRKLAVEVAEAQADVDERDLLAALMALSSQVDPDAHATLTITQMPEKLSVKGVTPDGDAIPLIAGVLYLMLKDRAEARKRVHQRLARAGQREWVGR